MKEIINLLIEHKPLSSAQARDAMMRIANEEFSDAEIAAFLTTYLMRAITLDELAGFRDALMELAIKPDLGQEPAIDLCGTGGDGKNTFNISTLTALVVAAAGYRVIKHGNYGVSSVSGSSNVLEYLDYTFTADAGQLQRQLDDHNICFLHAPLFHPAMKAVGPTRRSLKVKTFFNLLGPLVNPAAPTHQLVGVYSLQVARLYQNFLPLLNRQFTIVHALDGYDEITLTGAAKVIGNEKEQMLSASDFDYSTTRPEDLFGGATVAQAAEIFMQVLNSRGTAAQQQVVTANAALAIQCFEPQRPLTECVAQAEEALQSGRALQVFKGLLKQ